MDYSFEELKEIWTRSDKYFNFTFEEYKNFGSRLKKWRELNDLSQTDMAEALLSARIILNQPCCSIESIRRRYSIWENRDTNLYSKDLPFSMNNLYILKHILKCDYEFLLCEINTPHKYSEELSILTGLNLSSVEKLCSYNKKYNGKESSTSAIYAHSILTAINKLISDDELMAYLSYYLTNLDYYSELKDDDKQFSFSSISISKPVAGIPSEDAYMDGKTDILNSDSISQVIMFTLTNKLCNLRDHEQEPMTLTFEDLSDYESDPAIVNDDDFFGDRLKKWRESNKYTQDKVTDLIMSYREKHNLSNPEKLSVLRTYQNWERKRDVSKDVRLSILDLKMLKDIMDCDYDYLFGEINTLKLPQQDIIASLGFTPSNLRKLETYAASYFEYKPDLPAYVPDILSCINLLLTDNDLLSNLAYFLSNMSFDVDMNMCTLLKPIKIMNMDIASQDAYIKDLYNGKELRNVFLPAICDSLIRLRDKNHFNNISIKERLDREYPN